MNFKDYYKEKTQRCAKSINKYCFKTKKNILCKTTSSFGIESCVSSRDCVLVYRFIFHQLFIPDVGFGIGTVLASCFLDFGFDFGIETASLIDSGFGVVTGFGRSLTDSDFAIDSGRSDRSFDSGFGVVTGFGSLIDSGFGVVTGFGSLIDFGFDVVTGFGRSLPGSDFAIDSEGSDRSFDFALDVVTGFGSLTGSIGVVTGFGIDSGRSDHSFDFALDVEIAIGFEPGFANHC